MAAAKKPPMFVKVTKKVANEVTAKSTTAKTTKAPVTKPKTPAMPTKRPAVGADKSAKKKYGKDSWNNGYTN